MSEINKTEEAFAEQLAKDFQALGDTSILREDENGLNEIDRFYYVRFMALFSVMDAHLKKAGIPSDLRSAGYTKLFSLALQSFKTCVDKSREEEKEGKTNG